MPKTYRFNFSDKFTLELSLFATKHACDDIKTFKEYWNRWKSNNSMLIEEETRNLINAGYEGNMDDKMFKSARYYFKNKTETDTEPKKRRKYIPTSKNFLTTIDTYINSIQGECQPNIAFNNFCDRYTTVIKDEINILLTQENITETDISLKIKKTFKNRYFLAKNVL